MLITLTEAAQRLGVCRQTMRAAVNTGKIRTVTLNRRRLIPITELEKLVKANTGRR